MFSSWKDARDDQGAVLVEYALIMILVAMVAFAGIALFGQAVLELFTDNNVKMTRAVELSQQN